MLPSDSDGSDLVGDTAGAAPVANDSGANTGALDAVNSGISQTKAESEQQKEIERKQVKQVWTEYMGGRSFDKGVRATYAEDRKYAAGLGDPSWASDANLIGSDIDILVSFLYAKNPDVSVRAAEQVGDQPNQDNTQFALTLELIISCLWKLANLKKTARRQVRSALSVGPGWFKAIMWSKQRPQPAVEKELMDAEAQLLRIQALTTKIAEDDSSTDEDMDVEKANLTLLVAGLRAKKMKMKEYGMNIDFVRAEDMQVSLDVSSISDYCHADWCSEDMYIPKASLRTRFPKLKDDDATKATTYFQKAIAMNAQGAMRVGEDAGEGTFSKNAPAGTAGDKPVEFVKIVEFWDRRDGNIKTMCEGCECWAVDPYTPPQATGRFYPYFQLAFFEVDGQRHPQSLTGRLRKLQDEYSACRSNQRLTRERSIPGLFFNAALMSPEDAMKLTQAEIAEMVGIKPTDINTPIQSIVMAKPLPTIDTRLWDTSSIRADMEAISGVQEALSQNAGSSQPKTATEASIEQSGFASRTGSDRDNMEVMFAELAVYTAEAALQEIDPVGAQRIAGPLAFWPFGMDTQDLLTMVNVDIDAGSTGKPDAAADKQNWALLLPMIQKMLVQIRGAQLSDPGMADSMEELLKETLRRVDDRLDISDYMPKGMPTPPPPPGPPMPTVTVALKGDLPPLDASAIGAKAAGLPPEAMLADGGANAAAMQHVSGMLEGELPSHPLTPGPLTPAKATPMDGGKTQMPPT